MRFLLAAGDRLLRGETANGEANTSISFCHPVGKTVKCVTATQDRSRIVAGFTSGGVFCSKDGGESWRDVSGNLGHLDVRSAAIDPSNPDHLYIGTNPPAIYETRDGGETWAECEAIRNHANAGIWSNPRGAAQIRSICVSPEDSQLVYAAIEVGDLLRSQDGGKSWAAMSGVCHDQHRVVVSPADEDRVFLMTGQDTKPYTGEHGVGFFMTRDGGQTWENGSDRISTSKTVYCEDALVLTPEDPATLFVAIADGIPPRWKGEAGPNDYFVAPSRERRPQGADVTLHRSRDSGETWETLSGKGGLPDTLFDAVWAMDARREGSNTRVAYATTAGELWSSADGGDTWSKLNTTFPPISHLLLL